MAREPVILASDGPLRIFLSSRSALIDYAARIVGCRARAEDIVQEAWCRFETAARGRFLDEPTGYLYRIVRNLALDGRRQLAREHRAGTVDWQGAADQVPEDRPSPEAATLARDEFRLLAAALDELPERTRIALEMHRFGGFKLKEIAQRLDISVTLAHSLVAEGIAHCRKRLRRPS